MTVERAQTDHLGKSYGPAKMASEVCTSLNASLSQTSVAHVAVTWTLLRTVSSSTPKKF